MANKLKKFWDAVSGEINKLRIGGLSATVTYTLDTTKVDCELARSLYNNDNDAYKLGAWAAAPVINAPAGFMGHPRFRTTDPDAQTVLDAFMAQIASLVGQVHIGGLRDGDAYLFLKPRAAPEDPMAETPEALVEGYLLDPRQIKTRVQDPITNLPLTYVLKTHLEWAVGDSSVNADVMQTVNNEQITTAIVGATPPGLEAGTVPNPGHEFPIVHFRNASDGTNGHSELERIEPYMKAYHDVFMQAIQGHKLHSIAKLKLKIEDVSGFLKNNFGIEDPVKYAKENGAIKLDGKDALFMGLSEDMDYLSLGASSSAGTDLLLKLLFYCIVDASETPEFAFGVHTPSALASVKEQMPVLIRKVARKRANFEEGWLLVAKKVLALQSAITGKPLSAQGLTVLWDEIDPRDEKEVMEALKTLVEALVGAVNNDFLSREAAAAFLAKYVDTANDWVSDDPEIPGERERIIKEKVMLNRVQDGDLFTDEMTTAIAQAMAALQEAKAGALAKKV